MKLIKECVTLTMSPQDRDALREHLLTVHSHVEGYFNARTEDVESGTPDAKLMDAMHRIYDLCRLLDAGEYA